MAVAGLTLCSCADDFLDQSNSHQLSQTTFFDSDEAVQNALRGLKEETISLKILGTY